MRGVIDYEDTIIDGPTIEPLDLDEIKKALKFASTSEDTLIDVWASAARQFFETETGRALMGQTRERWLDRFPVSQLEIELPAPPLLEVLSISYLDGDGVSQVMDAADYTVIAPAGPQCGRGRVAVASAASWPTTQDIAKAVQIRYRCGYGEAPGDVPEIVKGVLYGLIAFFHRRGQDQSGVSADVPPWLQMMIRPYRESARSTLIPRDDTWP